MKSGPELSSLAIICVTFNPEINRFQQQIDSLPPESWLIVVDNATKSDCLFLLEELLAKRANSFLIKNRTNEGLATAINHGASFISDNIPEVTYLLLMDQDSIPIANAVQKLLNGYDELEKIGMEIGCVGPRLIDSATGLEHGFHCIKGWRWSRVFPLQHSGSPIQCANLNGSGTLLKIKTFQKLGGLEDNLFIDHVDTEWAFRVQNAGLKLFGLPDAYFDHAMGVRSMRFWCLGWRIWPYRSPLRHYYLFRNAVWLIKRQYVPTIWKIWATAKLLLTFIVHLIFDSYRIAQSKSMFRGVLEGIRFR